jgi:hypothetical protein
VKQIRRKPVPKEVWDRHRLEVWSRFYSGSGFRKRYRASGRCACGELFGELAHAHTQNRFDVIEDWKDHVARAHHGEDYIAA